MFSIIQFEIRSVFRQKIIYLLTFFWVVLLLYLFLLQSTSPATLNYTNTTSTILNLMLILVPLIILMNSSVSVANERENAQYKLLQTYPLSNFGYTIGKLVGQGISQGTVFLFSYGLCISISLLMGLPLQTKWVFFLLLFYIFLTYVFLLIGICIGLWSKNRWAAITLSICLWFFLLLFWPTFIIGTLNLLPYSFGEWFLKISLFVNPAEFLRLVFVSQLGGGSIFGQSYDEIVNVFSSGLSWMFLIYYLVVLTVLCLLFCDWTLTKRRG